MRQGRQLAGILLSIAGFSVGCGWFTREPAMAPMPGMPAGTGQFVPNPVSLPAQDSVFVWNQIVDTVDNYFRIEKEQEVVRSSGQWTEGRLETFPEIGATYLEPWKHDSSPGFERLLSTLQTIRRTAVVRAIPDANGYQIDVQVVKQLEDVDRSQSSTDGAPSLRHDGTIVRTDQSLRGAPLTLGWIDLGRDAELEQRILREIVGRLTNVNPPRKAWFSH